MGILLLGLISHSTLEQALLEEAGHPRRRSSRMDTQEAERLFLLDDVVLDNERSEEIQDDESGCLILPQLLEGILSLHRRTQEDDEHQEENAVASQRLVRLQVE